VVGWNVIAIEDVVGNGFDDIVIQNQTSGQIMYGNMTGGSFQGWNTITTVTGYTGAAGTGLSSSGSGGSGGSSSGNTGFGDGPPAPGTPIGPILDTQPGPSSADPTAQLVQAMASFAPAPAANSPTPTLSNTGTENAMFLTSPLNHS